jgi:hypothetical protein
VESLERVLVHQGYSKNKGCTRNTNEDHVQSEPDKVWSVLAQNNPIQAAAGTNASDWYAKYPQVVDQQIPNEEILAMILSLLPASNGVRWPKAEGEIGSSWFLS